MSRLARPWFAFLIAVCLIVGATGCVRWESVRPSELPKLGGGYATAVGRSGNSTLVAVSVVDVQRPDGTLVQLHGGYNIRVRVRSGQVLEFEHPVAVRLEGNGVVVSSANRPPTTLAPEDVVAVEASQPDNAATMVILVPLSALAGLLLFAAITM